MHFSLFVDKHFETTKSTITTESQPLPVEKKTCLSCLQCPYHDCYILGPAKTLEITVEIVKVENSPGIWRDPHAIHHSEGLRAFEVTMMFFPETSSNYYVFRGKLMGFRECRLLSRPNCCGPVLFPVRDICSEKRLTV